MRTLCALALTMPIADVPNSNDRDHWASKARKRAAMRRVSGALASFAYREAGPVEAPVNLTLRFAFPDRRRRDLDNYETKGLIDGLVDGGLIDDDDGTHIASVTRCLDTYKPGKGLVRITAELRTVGVRDVPEAEV